MEEGWGKLVAARFATLQGPGSGSDSQPVTSHYRQPTVTMTTEDLLQPNQLVKDRWKVVGGLGSVCVYVCVCMHACVCVCVCVHVCVCDCVCVCV